LASGLDKTGTPDRAANGFKTEPFHRGLGVDSISCYSLPVKLCLFISCESNECTFGCQ